MDKHIFNKFRKLIYEKSGICLKENKVTLICARIMKRMRALNKNDYKEYFDYLIADTSGKEIIQFLDAISTNVTSFYREAEHFDFMAEKITLWSKKDNKRDVNKRRLNRLRIWSAACSTGEEPYSILITLLETLKNPLFDLRILATDISSEVLETARQGCYRKDKVEVVNHVLRERYFTRDKNSYTIKAELPPKILFKRLNLSQTSFPMQGPMDFIFCRNVMIYFDNQVRVRLLAEMYRLLKPGGYLFVGHAESLTGMLSEFKSVRPSIYMKPE